MITLTPAFKTAIANGGPMKYRIEISEDNGISWQTIPSGADIISPLGTLSGETELEPFDFKGPDIELTAFNQDGYWTNSAKTGKLDTGLAVKMRILESPQSIANEWVQLIDGYIDLSSVVNYRTAFTCVFTVRGCLNILDSVLANFVLADRPATYPHKFGGWLKINSIDQSTPEGLYELRYDASTQMISWDNGPAVNIGIRGAPSLTGQSGNSLSVENMLFYHGDEAYALRQKSGTISQYIAVKSVSGVKTVLQNNLSLPLSWFKTKIANNIDLDISQVSAFPVANGDHTTVNYIPDQLLASSAFSRLYPVHVFSLAANKWYISFSGGALTGLYVLTVDTTDYLKVQSFVSAEALINEAGAVVVNSFITNNYCYLFCETQYRTDHRTNNTVRTWVIKKYRKSDNAQVGSYNGAINYLLWKSLAIKADDTFYGFIRTDDGSTDWPAKVYLIALSGTSTITITVKTTGIVRPGPSMCPAVISVGQYYIMASVYVDYTDNKGKVYLNLYDITNNQAFNILSEIEHTWDDFDYYRMGPIAMARNRISNVIDGRVDTETLGVYLLMGNIKYNRTDSHALVSGDSYIKQILIGNFSNPVVRVTSEAKDYDGTTYISTNETAKVYCPYFSTNVIDMNLIWTSGNNNTQSQEISAQSDCFATIATRRYHLTILTVSLPYTNPIVGESIVTGEPDGDDFKIVTDVFNASTARFTYKDVDVTDPVYLSEGSANPDTATVGPVSVGLIATIKDCRSLRYGHDIIASNIGESYVMAGGFNSAGDRLLLATQDNIIVTDIYTGATGEVQPNQYPEVALADFEDKNLRDAVQEAAISANCHLMPSEHNKRLSLIYRGKAANPQFTILNTEYSEGPRATPYYDYDTVTLNDKRAGVFTAGNRQRDISLTAQTTPDAYSQSLAHDILKHIGSGDRTHEIQVVGRIELEPGDEGFVELENGTIKTIMLLGHNTDPETLGRNLIVRES